jgi:hypothetical protein
MARPSDRSPRANSLAGDRRGACVKRILNINQSIRAVAFAGAAPGTREALIGALAGVKANPMREEAADESGCAASAPDEEPRQSAPRNGPGSQGPTAGVII